MIVEIRERPLVQPERLQPRFAERRLVLFQTFVHRMISGPDLSQENIIEYARCLNQLCQRLHVTR